jgi:CRISPR-associated endonuclease/helicase Cas3
MQADLFALHSNQDPSWMRYWGKTNRKTRADLRWHLLPYHNLDVAAAAWALLEQHPDLRKRLAQDLSLPEAQLQPFVCTLLALHDIGKYSERFQKVVPVPGLRECSHAGNYTVRHDTLGYLLLRHFWFEDKDWREELTQRWGLPEKDNEDVPMTADDWWDYLDPIFQAITGHHGKPPKADSHHASNQFDDESIQDARAYSQGVFKLFFPQNIPLFSAWPHDEAVARAKQASWVLAGLAVVADWIGSHANVEEHQPSDGEEKKPFFCFKMEAIPLETYWEKAMKQARQAIDRTGLGRVEPAASVSLDTLFPKLARYVPTPLQAYARTVTLSPEPQLFLLEDATGSGKTEAAALLTHRLLEIGCGQGLYFGLPTMATANAMYARFLEGDADAPYRRFFEEPDRVSVVLAHSRRDQSNFREVSLGTDNEEAYDQEKPEELRGRTYEADEPARAQCTRWLADSRKKALLAHVGIGTLDQALLGVLPSKHQSLRLFGLGTKVLIVDEVHAYDEYVSSLLCTLIRFHAALGGSTILLSATLTQELRQQFVDAFRDGLGRERVSVEKSDFPLATRVTASECREKQVDSRPGSERSTAVQFFHTTEAVQDQLLQAARAGQCACWIRNTVDDAVTAYCALKGEEGVEVMLFHARFTLADRLRIEQQVLQRFGPESTQAQRKGCILIATQVVEQSLDLDFDVMVSDLAPVDLLIQRAGRLHRHRRDALGNPAGAEGRSAPILGVLAPAFSPAASSVATADPQDKKKKGAGKETNPAEEAAAAWLKAYRQLFRKAQYVYPHVGYLWRTVQVLRERGCINSPGNIRDLLEEVYADDPPLPPSLEEASNMAFNEMKQARAEAAHNALHLAGGYGGLLAGAQHWYEDHHTPTRLGEPTATVRLGKLADGKIVPWSGDGWMHSEVSVRLRHLAKEPDWKKLAKEDSWPKNLDTLVEEAKEAMPDKGKWSLLIVLQETNGVGTGAALARQRKSKDDQDADKDDEKAKLSDVPVIVTYSPSTGLYTK